MNDYDIGGLGVANTFGILDVSKMERCAKLEARDVDFDGFGKVVGEAGDFDGMDVLFDDATGLDSGCLAIEVGGYVGRDFRLAVDGKEIGMEGGSCECVVLDGLKECKPGAFTLDIEVDEDILGRAVGDDIVEGACIDLEIPVFDAATVDHGGELAFAAHLVEATGAGAGTGSCLEGCFLGHGKLVVGQWLVVNRDHTMRCGGRVV